MNTDSLNKPDPMAEDKHNIRTMIYVWWWRNLARIGIGDPLNILVYHKPKARHHGK